MITRRTAGGIGVAPGIPLFVRIRLQGAVAADFGVSVIAQPQPCDLLVNATSVGLDVTDSIESLGLDKFAPPPLVADLVYSATRETPVARWGRGGGARVVDGLEVLIRQGALSFERWTGRPAPLDAMRQAAAKSR